MADQIPQLSRIQVKDPSTQRFIDNIIGILNPFLRRKQTATGSTGATGPVGPPGPTGPTGPGVPTDNLVLPNGFQIIGPNLTGLPLDVPADLTKASIYADLFGSTNPFTNLILPPAASVTASKAWSITRKDTVPDGEYPVANLAITVDGADTINGLNTPPYGLLANRGIILQSDGVSNWEIIASFKPQTDQGLFCLEISIPGGTLDFTVPSSSFSPFSDTRFPDCIIVKEGATGIMGDTVSIETVGGSQMFTDAGFGTFDLNGIVSQRTLRPIFTFPANNHAGSDEGVRIQTTQAIGGDSSCIIWIYFCHQQGTVNPDDNGF